jgi:hypothetical protein
MPSLAAAKEIVRALKKYEKVYGTFTMRKINGVPAEYSFMIKDNNGQHWHFMTSDFRWSGNAFFCIRKTSGPRDFTGEQNIGIDNVDMLARLSLA